MARPSEMSIPKEHACLYPHCARLSPGRGADLGRGLPPGRVDSPWGMGASPPPPHPKETNLTPKWHQRPCWVEDSWTHYILGYLGLGTQRGTEEAAESTALFCSVRNHPTRVRGPWSSDGWGQFSLTSWEGAGVTSANPSPLFPHVTF